MGVLTQANLQVSDQCSRAARSADVGPRLEYCVQAWRPHLQKDFDLLEKVQRRKTPMIQECKGVTYEERFTRLNLTSLKTRHLKGDVTQVFNIVKGFD